MGFADAFATVRASIEAGEDQRKRHSLADIKAKQEDRRLDISQQNADTSQQSADAHTDDVLLRRDIYKNNLAKEERVLKDRQMLFDLEENFSILEGFNQILKESAKFSGVSNPQDPEYAQFLVRKEATKRRMNESGMEVRELYDQDSGRMVMVPVIFDEEAGEEHPLDPAALASMTQGLESQMQAIRYRLGDFPTVQSSLENRRLARDERDLDIKEMKVRNEAEKIATQGSDVHSITKVEGGVLIIRKDGSIDPVELPEWAKKEAKEGTEKNPKILTFKTDDDRTVAVGVYVKDGKLHSTNTVSPGKTDLDAFYGKVFGDE